MVTKNLVRLTLNEDFGEHTSKLVFIFGHSDNVEQLLVTHVFKRLFFFFTLAFIYVATPCFALPRFIPSLVSESVSTCQRPRVMLYYIVLVYF